MLKRLEENNNRVELNIVSPVDNDREKIYDLLAKVFSKSWGYYEFFKFCKERYLYHSSFDQNTSKIGTIGDKVVSFCGVMDYKMRIGSAELKVAGVGGVAVDANYRKMGFMQKTMTECISSMKARGYQLSLLYGIPDYYDRFGYQSAWPLDCYVVPLSTFDIKPLPFKINILDNNSTIPDTFFELYNNYSKKITGTMVRPTYRLNRFPDKWEIFYWNKRGLSELAGYIVVEKTKDRLICIEACGNTNEIFQTLSFIAAKKNSHEIEFPWIAYHSILAKAIRKGTYRLIRERESNAGPMIRIINLRNTFEKITGLLNTRLRKSTYNKWSGELLIRYREENITLVIDRSTVTVSLENTENPSGIIEGKKGMAQLLVGSTNPFETVENNNIIVTGEAKKLLNILFPEQFPAFSRWDKF